MKYELIKHANIIRSNDEHFYWMATNLDPQFLIANAELLAGRKIRISFKLEAAENIIILPKLYLDCGTGTSEFNSIELQILPGNRVNQVISFPWNIKFLRFDPMAQMGAFTVKSFTIDVLGRTETLLTRLKRTITSWLKGGQTNSQIVHNPGPRTTVPEEEKTYERWIRLYEPNPNLYPEFRKWSQAWHKRPLISIILPTYNTPKIWLREAIDSVLNQAYENWELCIADDASTKPYVKDILKEYASKDSRIKIVLRSKNGHISTASNSAMELATGNFVGLFDHDDLLHPLALYFSAEEINASPDAMLIYSDEDFISSDGERNLPYFKCEFNYDLFLAHNMITHFGIYKTSLVRELGGFREDFDGAQDYDLALRFIEKISFEQIKHIPRVLYHWRMHSDSSASGSDAKPYAHIAAMRSIQEHLDRKQVAAKVESAAEAKGCNRVRYTLPITQPSVEIIIPTRDGLELLRQCLISIVNKTTYQNYVITIIDNGSVESDTLSYLQEITRDQRIRVKRDDSPFNFSALNNRVGLKSTADFVLLLNNDIEVINTDWLTEMVSVATQPGVGCVGARLWYPNDTLQHGGLIYGLGGVVAHSHKQLKRGLPGYAGRVLHRQTLSGVTGACLLISQHIYKEVSGLNENFKVAYNDVDFCLRVMEAGYRNVWTPFADLYHHESATRGYEDTPEKRERLQTEATLLGELWGNKLHVDPFYSPNLTLDSEDFSMAWPPRVATY
jgi:O-antigen biosynthesis protein